MSQVDVCPDCHQPKLIGHVCANAPILTELERRRLDNSNDSTKHTPEQILRMALDDIRTGEVQPNACFIVLITKSDTSNKAKTTRYRAGLRKIEEVAFLDVMHAYAIEEWKR